MEETLNRESPTATRVVTRPSNVRLNLHRKQKKAETFELPSIMKTGQKWRRSEETARRRGRTWAGSIGGKVAQKGHSTPGLGES
jgi:hypothetical protein